MLCTLCKEEEYNMGRAKRTIAVMLAVLVGLTSTPHDFVLQAAEQGETYIVYGGKERVESVKAIPRVGQAKKVYHGKLKKQEVCELREEGAIVEKDIELSGSSKQQETVEQGEIEENWNLKMVHAAEGETEVTGKKVKIAVMDSGIDAGNQKIYGYYDTTEENEIPRYFEDLSGHGTSVAGIIHHIAEDAQIYSVKVLDVENKTVLSKVISGIYWCIENDMDIINMSFGTSTKSEVLEKAIQDAKKAGILIVAAAGNKNEKGVEYPAAYDGVLAVGAVDSQAEKTEESAVGAEVDIVAPGQQIVSDGLFGMNVVTGGTSMSAPHVTGAAALLWSKDRGKSAEFIQELLKQSARPLGEVSEYGKGLLDVQYAFERYTEFVEVFQPGNGKEEQRIVKNEEEIQTTETDLVEGSWTIGGHNQLFDNAISGKYDGNADDLKKIKLGAVMPDKVEVINGKNFAAFHGYHNFIANTKAITRLALNGNSCTVETISALSSEVDKAKRMISALRDFDASDWKQGGVTGIPSAADKKLYFYGIAIHIATDAVAHVSYDASGRQIVHDGNKGADDPGTLPIRYEYATHLAYRIVRAYKAGNQTGYATFVPDDTNLLNKMLSNIQFTIRDLYYYALRVDSSFKNNLTHFDFLNRYTYIYKGSSK